MTVPERLGIGRKADRQEVTREQRFEIGIPARLGVHVAENVGIDEKWPVGDVARPHASMSGAKNAARSSGVRSASLSSAGSATTPTPCSLASLDTVGWTKNVWPPSTSWSARVTRRKRISRAIAV